jgi:hypothetical protein
MWTRDPSVPASSAYATWTCVAPFFHLCGLVASSQRTVSVRLHPFHGRQDTRDLSLPCHRVYEKHFHGPDGRLLLYSIQGMTPPIRHQQPRLIVRGPGKAVESRTTWQIGKRVTVQHLMSQNGTPGRSECMRPAGQRLNEGSSGG